MPSKQFASCCPKASFSDVPRYHFMPCKVLFHAVTRYRLMPSQGFMLSQGNISCYPKILFHAVLRYHYMPSQDIVSCRPKIFFHAVQGIVSCCPKVSFHAVSIVSCRPKVSFHAIPRYRFMLSQGIISCPRYRFMSSQGVLSCRLNNSCHAPPPPRYHFYDIPRYHFMPCMVLFHAVTRNCFIPSQGIVFMWSKGIDSIHAIPSYYFKLSLSYRFCLLRKCFMSRGIVSCRLKKFFRAASVSVYLS
jgi:hypothetical protein